MKNLLFLEINKVFVVSEDLDIGESSPGILNLLSCNGLFGFLSDLLFAFPPTPVSPLDLNSSNMVHGESMVLEQASGQRHFVSSLN